MKEPVKWPLFAVSPLPQWVSASGKFALLGDAAHAMVPYLALGNRILYIHMKTD